MTLAWGITMMSRSPGFARQAFRNLPSYWEFRKFLDEPLFRWRAAFETRMDSAHDATMSEFRGQEWTLEDDVRPHVALCMCKWATVADGG